MGQDKEEVEKVEQDCAEGAKCEKEEKLSRKEKKALKKMADEAKAALEEEFVKQKEELESRIEEFKDKYLRLSAEFDNYRKRTAQERLDLINTAGEDVIKGLLPTLDVCEKAVAMLKGVEGSEAALEGTQLIYDNLLAYLKTKGVERIEAMGAEFNTDEHEAIAQMPVPEEDKKNHIIDVTRQGYKLKDKVIRYAQVVVGI